MHVAQSMGCFHAECWILYAVSLTKTDQESIKDDCCASQLQGNLIPETIPLRDSISAWTLLPQKAEVYF